VVVTKRGSGRSASGKALPTITVRYDPAYEFDFRTTRETTPRVPRAGGTRRPAPGSTRPTRAPARAGSRARGLGRRRAKRRPAPAPSAPPVSGYR
jgi:hypothetical protein